MTTLSASGIMIDPMHGLVLTSGALVMPFVANKQQVFQQEEIALLKGTELNLIFGKKNFKAKLICFLFNAAIDKCLLQLFNAKI